MDCWMRGLTAAAREDGGGRDAVCGLYTRVLRGAAVLLLAHGVGCLSLKVITSIFIHFCFFV